MLWADVKKHFTLPEDVDENLLKGWTLSKMATQFQNFKKRLDKDFVKKGLTPNWNDYPKLQAHWDSFVEYKSSEQHAAKSVKNKALSEKKGSYNHRLGRGGYMVAIPKWKKMEEELMGRGIIPAVVEWPERSKYWFYARGGSINPDDGSLIVPPTLRQKAEELMQKIADVKAGKIKVDREIDELTLALRNPEHPGRYRGYGVVPWKYAFKRNVDTYRSHKRRREREEDKWRQQMEQRLKQQEDRMQEEIDRRLVARINEMAQTGALPAPIDPIISPSQHKSSCASTEAPDDNTAIVQVPVVRYPVDDICQRTPCELHKPFGNITVKVPT